MLKAIQRYSRIIAINTDSREVQMSRPRRDGEAVKPEGRSPKPERRPKSEGRNPKGLVVEL